MAKILFDTSEIVPNKESRIVEVEKMINARLPDDYRTYLLKYNGASPMVKGYEEYPIFVRVEWPEGEPAMACGDIHTLHEPSYLLENWKDWSIQQVQDIRWQITNIEGNTSSDTIAIWRDPGSNFFLLGIRKHNFGKVFYQARAYIRFDENNNVTHHGIAFVANSFTEFIQKIEPDPEDYEAWKAAGRPHLPLEPDPSQ